MTAQPNLTSSILNVSLVTKMLVGASIGLVLISIYLIGIKDPDPAWGEYWMIRPLVLVTLAGATGGLFFAVASYLRLLYNWNTILINLLCFIVFVIGLFMGTVLGLDGTMFH